MATNDDINTVAKEAGELSADELSTISGGAAFDFLGFHIRVDEGGVMVCDANLTNCSVRLPDGYTTTIHR